MSEIKMNREEKKLWLKACDEWHANSGGKDLGEFMFMAGLNARKSKVKNKSLKVSSALEDTLSKLINFK